jgi:hypothetical protein
MAKLSGPYEVFDIGDGEAVQIRVMRTAEGEIDIHPQYGEAVKTVQALRLYLEHPWVAGRLPYLDITSQRLRMDLLGRLRDIPPEGKMIRITKHGVAPKALFTVENIV